MGDLNFPQSSEPVAITDEVSGNQVSVNSDGSLNVIASQKVQIVTANSSTSNLTSGSSFTGTSTSTTGANAIGVNIFCDQNVNIQVQQSSDGSNWDIKETYTIFANNGDGRVSQIVGAFYRLIVTNIGNSTTTVFRLASALIPGSPVLPRSLSQSGALKVNLVDSNSSQNKQDITRFSEAEVTFRHNHFFEDFDEASIDNTKWNIVTASGGTATIPNFGEVQLATTTTNGSQSKINSIIPAQSIPGTDDIFRIVARINTSSVSNNRIRIGVYDSVSGNGFFFQYDGTNLTAVIAKSNSLTLSNNLLGITLTNYNTFQITYSSNSVSYYVNGILVYNASVSGSTSTLVNLINLPTFLENFNTGLASSTNILYCSGISVYQNGVADHLPVLNQTVGQDATENGQMFSIASGIITNGGGNNVNSPILYINNPSTSGTILFIEEFNFACLTDNRDTVFSIFSNPTVVSGGSLVTPTNTFIGNSSTSITTGDRIGTLTATTNGTLILNYGIAQNSSIGQFLVDRKIMISPGNSILITALAKGGTIDVLCSIVWSEDGII